jgi:hypothetical protein
MPKAFETWTVLEHRPIKKLTENLWKVVGTVPRMELKRQMVVARRSDGTLLIHGAIALNEASMAEIEAWGTPAFILVPNGWHRLDCVVYKQRYPSARVLCPAGSRKRVEQVIAVDGTYDDFPADDTVSLVAVDGIKQAEGVLRVVSEEGTTLVFNDLIFNLPHGRGLAGLIFRILGSTGGPKVTRIMRLFAVKDMRALKANLLQLAEEPGLCRIIPGHGRMIDEDPAMVLRGVAAAL